MPLPEEVYRVLVEVVEAMREGKVVTLVPRSQRLTTQEAADFLGISRPTMVKLLEGGKIPYEQPGRHRRILFTDLLAYTERQHADRRAALDRMTEDTSEAGIYGGAPEDYATALKKPAGEPPARRTALSHAALHGRSRRLRARTDRASRHAAARRGERPVLPAVVRAHPRRGAGGHRGNPPCPARILGFVA
ncbi:MAG: helix-turn-helix domain-containing protein [Streptosporangiaceae bacterium]